MVEKRSKLFKKILQCIGKPYLVDDYHDILIGFTRSPNSSLTEDGKWLVRRAKSMSDYYIHTKKEEGNRGTKDITTSSVGSPDIFLANFVEMYRQNKNDFCGSLAGGLSKAVIAKIDGCKNPLMSTKVFNFFRVLEALNRKSFDFVSANLAGPCICSTQKRNVKGRDRSFIDYDLEFIKQRLLKVIEMRVNSETDCLSTSVSIDDTKNAKGIKISSSYKCLFGGAFPHHIILLDGLEEDTIKKMTLNKNKEVQDAY